MTNDYISRQDAIDIISRSKLMTAGAMMDCKRKLEGLPSAQPERKKGEWKKSYAAHEAFGMRLFFRYCSECHEATVYPYNFCPNCGADMRGENNG